MCSNEGALGRAYEAIRELAGRSAGEPGAPEGDDIAARLAEAWAMIADADPEVARRLRGYLDQRQDE
jgi:hypothetical protein